MAVVITVATLAFDRCFRCLQVRVKKDIAASSSGSGGGPTSTDPGFPVLEEEEEGYGITGGHIGGKEAAKEAKAKALAAEQATRMDRAMDSIVVLFATVNSVLALAAGYEYAEQFKYIHGARSCKFNYFLAMSMFKPIM
jgi:hypothetical protein